MAIATTNLIELAAQQKKPFDLIEAAQVDEMGVYVTISHGRFGWQRHVDEDEVFLVLNGLVSLDSEWGSLTLHAGEMVLVPKGVGHRTASLWRSTVALFRPRMRAATQNGQRRLHAVPGEHVLQKENLYRAGGALMADYSLKHLSTMGAYHMFLQRGVGISSWRMSGDAHRMILIFNGDALLETAFDGAMGPLVHFLVEEKQLTPKEQAELVELLRDEDEGKGENHDRVA